MAIKGSAFAMNPDSRQRTPEKILNIKIHKSEVPQQNAVDTKENTQDKSKDVDKTQSNNVSGRENGVDPQAWIRDQELSGK